MQPIPHKSPSTKDNFVCCFLLIKGGFGKTKTKNLQQEAHSLFPLYLLHLLAG